MAKPTSILGVVETKEIKIGAGRIFRGTSAATSFAGTAKFDTNNPGATWEDMGCIATDTTLASNVTMFKYTNGVPTALKKAFVTGRDATLTSSFDEFKSRVLQTALGLKAPINKLVSTLYTVQASPTPTNILFALDTISGLNAGDELVVEATSGLLPASTNAALIDSIATLTINLRTANPLFQTPASTWVAKKRMSTKLCFGGSDVATYPLLYVIDFVSDKRQIVFFFPKVSSTGSFSPKMGAGTAAAMVSIPFDCYGVYDADLDDNVLTEMFLFEDEQ